MTQTDIISILVVSETITRSYMARCCHLDTAIKEASNSTLLSLSPKEQYALKVELMIIDKGLKKFGKEQPQDGSVADLHDSIRAHLRRLVSLGIGSEKILRLGAADIRRIS